eukprot:jgi/Ulvmu1/3189/UM015_0230.1
MATESRPVKPSGRRVRFSQLPVVHLFEADANPTERFDDLEPAEHGPTDTASEDEIDAIDAIRERAQVFFKLGDLQPWSSVDVTTSNALMADDNDVDADAVAYAQSQPSIAPFVDGGNGPNRLGHPHHRPSVAFAYQRASIMHNSPTEKMLTDDDTGPLAGLPHDYYKTGFGMTSVTPKRPHHGSGRHSAVHSYDDAIPPPLYSVSGSMTIGMDTDVSERQYHTQQISGCVNDMPSRTEQQDGFAAKRSSPFCVHEDTVSWETAGEHSCEQPGTVHSVQQGTSGIMVPPDNANKLVCQPNIALRCSAGRRSSSNRSRTALAPLSSHAGMQSLKIHGAGSKNDEANQTENLLNGDIMVDSELFNAQFRKQVFDKPMTPRDEMLQFDERFKAIGHDLLDLDSEKVDDEDYLLQSIVGHEGQDGAGGKSLSTGDPSPHPRGLASSSIPVEEATGQQSCTRQPGSGTASMLTPTKNRNRGYDNGVYKSPKLRQGLKRGRSLQSPLRQVSSRLRFLDPKSPCPTAGTPLHSIREESKSPTEGQHARQASTSADEGHLNRALPFVVCPVLHQQQGNDEDEMMQPNACGDLLPRTPPGQLSAPTDMPPTPSTGDAQASPGRAPPSPLSDVSAHAFMKMTGMQQKIDECKLPGDILNEITCITACGKPSPSESMIQHVEEAQGIFSKLACHAVDQACGARAREIVQQACAAQIKAHEQLLQVESRIAEDRSSLFQAVKYAKCEQRDAILEELMGKLVSARADAIGQVHTVMRSCESFAHERLGAAGFKSRQAFSVNNEACEAVCEDVVMVEDAATYITELKQEFQRLQQAERYRYTSAQDDVARLEIQVHEIGIKLDTSQDLIKALEVDVDFKKSALSRILIQNEKMRQDKQAAEAERIKHEGIRNNLLSICDDTGCLFKRANRAKWHGTWCMEVTWELAQRVSCILRFPESTKAVGVSSFAIFLEMFANRTTEGRHLELLLASCLLLDAGDGRCRLVEQTVPGPPSNALKWCKTMVTHLEALAHVISWLPVKIHMVVAASVSLDGRVQIKFIDVTALIEIDLTFAASIVTIPEADGMLTVYLEDYRHNAEDSDMADLIAHTLHGHLQPVNGHECISMACLDLRGALLASKARAASLTEVQVGM